MAGTKHELEALLRSSKADMELMYRSMLGRLTEKEQAVLEARFGVGHRSAMREQILDAEKRALEKLKGRK